MVRADARVVHVLVDDEVRLFAPRGKLFDDLAYDQKHPLAVGDRVLVSLEGDPPGVEQVLPRANYLPRVASSHDPREQVLFANVDQLLVIGSLKKPGFSSNRTDRILVACEYYEIPTLLVLNKVDLDRAGEAEAIADTYRAAGVPVLHTSALEGTGVAELAERLRGRTSVFYGGSGAGKSSLLNAIQPGLALKTGKISKYWDAGKHTTTHSSLLWVEAVDGWVIDTPGIRVFRLAGINKAELRDAFPEFAPYVADCRYPDCAHDHEPECAVFEAVDRGRIAATRYASYVEMLEELVPPPPDDSPEPPPERG